LTISRRGSGAACRSCRARCARCPRSPTAEASDEGAARRGGGPTTTRHLPYLACRGGLDVRTLDPPFGAVHRGRSRAALLAQVDAYTAIATVIAFVVKSVGYPGAVAFLDAPAARDFVLRFLDRGVPSVWHAGSLVQVSVHGLDPTDAATCRELAGVARGRWFWAAPGEPALIDAATMPPPRLAQASGAGRAARRRGGGG